MNSSLLFMEYIRYEPQTSVTNEFLVKGLPICFMFLFITSFTTMPAEKTRTFLNSSGCLITVYSYLKKQKTKNLSSGLVSH